MRPLPFHLTPQQGPPIARSQLSANAEDLKPNLAYFLFQESVMNARDRCLDCGRLALCLE